MSVAIVSFPVRRLLGQMFAAEREARIADVLQEKRSQTVVGGFVKSGGHFDKAEEALEDLLDDDSPLLEDMCSVIGEHENAVKRNRGMVLRLKASVRYRLSRRTRRTTGYYEIVRTMDENTQEAKDKFCNAFMARA